MNVKLFLIRIFFIIFFYLFDVAVATERGVVQGVLAVGAAEYNASVIDFFSIMTEQNNYHPP